MGSIERYRKFLEDFKEVFKLKMKIANKQIELDLVRLLENYDIDDPFTVERAMAEQPSLYFRFASLLSLAKNQLKRAEFEKHIWHSEIRNKVSVTLRKSAKENALKSPTKEDIETEIIKRFKFEYTSREKKIRALERKIGILQAAVTACSQRKDMLSSIGILTSRLLDQGILVLEKTKRKKLWGRET